MVGWLQPEEGVARVLAPRTGVVTGLHVNEGTSVRKGDRLLTLSDELQSSTLGGTQAEIGRQLAQRRDSLVAERTQMQRLFAQQQAALSARAAALGAEQAQINREIELLRARLAIAQRNLVLHREQQAAGYISGMRLQMVEAEHLEQAARLGLLERNRLTIKREAMGVQAELKDLPLKAEKELAAIERSLAQIGQERAESEARREIVLTAPHDGTVTAIQAVAGTAASPTVPLLSIVPAGTRLEAHLYGPSRAIGFVRPGQHVRLRYQAYPYQRFGHHEGVIASVSRSAVSPAELPAQLTGVARPTGPAAAGSTAAPEPLYRIVVSIASQSIAAYGNAIALQPGMAIEADVALDRRKLYEWVLDPIYAVTGKWQ